MRFLIVLLAGGFFAGSSAYAQVEMLSQNWDAGLGELLLFACIPVAMALAGVAARVVWRLLHPRAENHKFGFLAYGKLPLVWAGLVLLAGLSLTWYEAFTTWRDIYARAWGDFQRSVDRVESDIQRQFDRPLGALRAIRVAFHAGDEVTRAEFRDLIAARDPEEETPGVRGYALLARVKRSELAAFVAQQRIGGQPDFSVRTSGSAPDLYVVNYIEPMAANAAAVGFDIGAEPVRRAAAERAMREGRPALSARIALVQDGLSRPGFLYFLPFYKAEKVPETEEQRLRTFRGWLNAPIVLGDLLAHSVAATQGMVEFQVFDGADMTPQGLMLDSEFPQDLSAKAAGPDRFSRRMFETSRSLLVGGRLLQLRAATTPDFENSMDPQKPARLAFTGSALSVLVSMIVWLLLVGRTRALALASSMTADLNRLAMVVRRTSNAVIISDVQRRIVWVNEGFTRLTGYSEHEAIGQYAGQLLASERSDPATTAAIAQELDAGLTCRHLMINRTKGGRDYWVRLEIQPVRDASGAVSGFMSVESDVTAEIEAKEALEREKERADRVLQGANVGTWEVNTITNAARVSERWFTMLGFAPEEVPKDISAFWGERVHPEDFVRSNDALAAFMLGASDRYACELRVQRKDGTWIWVLSRANILSRTPDGAVEWLAGIHMDITEQKVAELALAKTSATLQTVLDSAVDVAVFATDLHRRITVFNKGAENLLGYQASEIVGQRAKGMLLDPAQLQGLAQTLAAVLGRQPTADEVFAKVVGSREQQVWNFVRKDGVRFEASLIFSPMVGAEGELLGHLGIAHDVSKQKQYEESLRAAMQLAEQSSVAKSQFLANMSHEIRTPMNAILGMLALLKNTPLSERQRDYAGKTEIAAKSLLGLLNDILDFSKVEAGKMVLDQQPFVLDQMLAELSVILSANLGEKNVEVLFDIDPALPKVLVGDAMRLKQILINLAGNAVKFTEQGEVVLKCHVVQSTTEQVTVGIEVQDSGIGIAPENQVRIFEGFSQAEASTTRRFGGTGLGLVISARLVHLMGGELSVSSALGQGSTFAFSLEFPLLPNAVDTTGHHGVAHAASELEVLLVDDNALAMQTSAAMMRTLGWTVTQAVSGDDAVNAVQSRHASGSRDFDAIFVDYQMPGMDGWQTLRSIRRLYTQGAVPPMIMLSSKGADFMARRTTREQELLDGFLVKPLTATMFENMLSTAKQGAGLPDHSSANNGVSLQRLSGMRVLVVEDNLINQQVAQELLTAEGALVTLADNGQDGVDAVAKAASGFDVVLMDLQMPVMGGLDATRAIRQDLGLHDLPVVAMTANAMASDREACLAAGMNDHIGKPFDLNHLVQILVHHTQWEPSDLGGLAATHHQISTPDAPPAVDWPESIDGAAALVRMGGNAGLLAKTMQAFARDASRFPDKIAALMAGGDAASLQLELHSFKGLSATLGIGELSRLSAQAEALVKQVGAPVGANEPLIALMVQVRTQIATTLPLLESLASRMVPQKERGLRHVPVSMGIDASAAIQQLRRLREVLHNSDMVAMELHASLRQTVTEIPDADWDPLDGAMAELDFDLAAHECDVLLATLTQ